MSGDSEPDTERDGLGVTDELDGHVGQLLGQVVAVLRPARLVDLMVVVKRGPGTTGSIPRAGTRRTARTLAVDDRQRRDREVIPEAGAATSGPRGRGPAASRRSPGVAPRSTRQGPLERRNVGDPERMTPGSPLLPRSSDAHRDVAVPLAQLPVVDEHHQDAERAEPTPSKAGIAQIIGDLPSVRATSASSPQPWLVLSFSFLRFYGRSSDTAARFIASPHRSVAAPHGL